MEQKYREVYVYLLITSMFISISVFEIFVGIGLLWIIWDLIKKRALFEGSLKYPLVIYASVSVLSTAFFAPKMMGKSIEEGIFQFLYFFKVQPRQEFIRNIQFLFITIGVLLIPIVLYHYQKLGITTPIWGGQFEVGQFYSMFTIISGLLGLYFFKRNRALGTFFIVLSLIFFSILILSHRRSPLLGFLVVFYLLLFIFSKNKVLPKMAFVLTNLVFVISLVGGYVYLSKTDYRFKLLNNVIIGKEKFNLETLNSIGSNRVHIAIDAVNIIKTDLKQGNWINLLIGHGIRSGYYLPHVYSPKNFVKYESIFILSEFIEKGLIGLLAILAIFFIAFKTFISIKIKTDFDLVAIGLFVPLLIHLVGSIFTFFWDALLPAYLLLFKIGEVYFKKEAANDIQKPR